MKVSRTSQTITMLWQVWKRYKKVCQTRTRKEFLVRVFEEFQKKNKKLQKNFSILIEECKNTSQISHYFEYVLYMVSLPKQLIAANHNGDWEIHLQTLQIIPVFNEFDSINYFRYRSLYLEQTWKLPQDYPEIYDKFMNELFVVKQKTESFNAVAGD